ncbi:NAD-dependent epimerase/dehydratase family protein [Parasutterella secunda]|uniref:NAD-dependent epimerase/dehydratase family protein n=1 Tax=Parasutterella secunda TaxID=626947 RepID=UPI0025A3A271|nr:NAD-dependent epimerase/dehydratase family protein [Parasutterella secunda]MDM8217881.1 NAD-dependent epimerase/dehydratase family protein [Parasutterella secunda]
MLNYYNQILIEDLKEVTQGFSSSYFENKTILIAGANGMLATYLAFFFLNLVITGKVKLRLLLLSKNRDSLKSKFSNLAIPKGALSLIAQDVSDPLQINEKLDFIFHFAGNASPFWINSDPVGIMKANILGTINLLELAKKNEAKFIYASTREVYGKVLGETEISEKTTGSLDCLSNRSCYPESKRASESLCLSYGLQYGVDFNVIRISHVYGPGMKLGDGRIMSDLINSVVTRKGIVLKSQGTAIRSFCYISDAISAILRISIYGNSGEAYNLSNETEEISVIDLANLMMKIFPDRVSSVKFNFDTNTKQLYCDYSRVRLNVDKLYKLGWYPKVKLNNGIMRTVSSFDV